jgi:hypothetical protein
LTQTDANKESLSAVVTAQGNRCHHETARVLALINQQDCGPRFARLEEQFGRQEALLNRLDNDAKAKRQEQAGELAGARHTEDDWARLEVQGLFIIGNARSGTSIFADCLNVSRDVYLLPEPDFFLNHVRDDFVEFFNARHQSHGNLLRKGTRIPLSPDGKNGASDLLHRMRKWYRYVGEKLAIGPSNAFGEDWQSRCIEFYGKYFYRSAYFLIMREPTEVIWSMRKKFPECTPITLLESWLQSTDFLVDLYLAFENTHLTFFDRLSAEMLDDVAGILGMSLKLPAGMIDEKQKHSTLAATEIPRCLRPYRDSCQHLHQVYDLLRENFCPHTFRYRGVDNFKQFFLDIKQRIRDLLGEIRQSCSVRNAA